MRKAVVFLNKYIKRNWVSFSIYMSLCVVCSMFSLISPYISGNFIDALLQMEKYDQLVGYCIVFAILSVGAILSNFALSQIFASLKIKINYETLLYRITK